MKRLLAHLLYKFYKLTKYIINLIYRLLYYIFYNYMPKFEISNLEVYKYIYNILFNQYFSVYLFLILHLSKKLIDLILKIIIFNDNIIERWPYHYIYIFLPWWKKTYPNSYKFYKCLKTDITKLYDSVDYRLTFDFYYNKYENKWWKLILDIILLLFCILPIIWIIKLIINIYKYFIIYICLLCDVIFLDFIFCRFITLSENYIWIRTWIEFLLYKFWAQTLPEYLIKKLLKLYKYIFPKRRKKVKPKKQKSYRRFFRPRYIYFMIWNVSLAMKERVRMKRRKLEEWRISTIKNYKNWWKDFKWRTRFNIWTIKPRSKNFIKSTFIKFLWKINYLKIYPYLIKIFFLWIKLLIGRFIIFCHEQKHWYSFRYRILKIRYRGQLERSWIWWKYRFNRRYRIIKYNIWWYSKFIPLYIKRFPIFIYEYIIWYIRWFKRWIRIIPKWYFRIIKTFIKAIPRYFFTFYFTALYEIRIKRRIVVYNKVLVGLHIRYRFKFEYYLIEPIKFRYYRISLWFSYKIWRIALFFLHPPWRLWKYDIKIKILNIFKILIDNRLTNTIYILVIPYRIRYFLEFFCIYNNVMLRMSLYFFPLTSRIHLFRNKIRTKYNKFFKNIIIKTKKWDKKILRKTKYKIIGVEKIEKKKIFTTYAIILVWTWEIIKLITFFYIIYTFSIWIIYYYCKLYIYLGFTLPSIKNLFLFINIM